MSTSRAYHHGDLRDTLVQAALHLLEAGGSEALTLRAAARRAGVSAMAPYRHFADKADLLRAVAAAGFQDLRAALDTADREPEPLVQQGRAYVAFALARPALFRLMFAAPGNAPTNDAAPHPGVSAYAVLERRVAALMPPAEAPAAAIACWALVHGMASLAIDGRLQAPAETVGAALRILARGLKAPAPPTAAAAAPPPARTSPAPPPPPSPR